MWKLIFWSFSYNFRGCSMVNLASGLKWAKTDSDVDAILFMLKSDKNLVLLFFHNPFLHFLHILIMGRVMVMSCWSTWSTPSPNQRPREPPTWCINKVGQKYILCNLIDWIRFNLLFDWHSRSKVKTYICQKVEDSWIYNLGGGHLWVLVKK